MTLPDAFQRESLSFYSDGFRLEGTLHLPPVFPTRVVIGSHGLLSTGDSQKQVILADKCCENNIAFFRFDHRGCGRSSGRFSRDTTFQGRVNDLMAAIQTLLDLKTVGNTIGLFGSSIGGAAAIMAWDRFPISVIGVLAAPVSLSQIQGVPEELKAMPDINPVEFRNNLEFDLTDKLAGLKNIIIFHGDEDAVVPYENALTLFSCAGEPKKLVRQSGGDHRMTHPTHQKEFFDEIVLWYLAHFS